ncbi:MAG: hypothetical protein JRJ04_11030 [Deltaproteobacteria bacterium]|nr:hypothetical protein [Deltaproteobacteria bacterium]
MVEYKRQTLKIADDTGLEGILDKIRELTDVVVVNIASNRNEPLLFFSMENLCQLHSKGFKDLVLETITVGEYGGLILNEIKSVSESSGQIRELLRDHFVDDIKETIGRFLDQLNNILVLLGCYALQRPKSAAAELYESLKAFHEQLSSSCFRWRDNVRCLDDLQYGIKPTLDALAKEFKSTRAHQGTEG